MIKLGLVGAFGYHAQAFSKILNQYTPDTWKELGLLPDTEFAEALTQTHIVKVWDKDLSLAKELASKFGIKEVVEKLESVGKGVDGVIIVDQNGGRKHHLLSHYFLKNNIPTFLDKPLADTLEEAEEIFALVREKGTLFMSCSALRFALEVEQARKAIKEIGPISIANCIGPGHPVNYGIHTLEFCLSVLGSGVKSVYNIGSDNASMTKLTYQGGVPEVCIQIGAEIKNQYRLTICGKEEWVGIVPTEVGTYGYGNMLKNYIAMLVKKESPIALEETEDIIKVLLASAESLKIGKPVELKSFGK